MTTIPAISVVIPLYNKGLYIQRAIKSVLNQTYKNFELIVVDDGSTDGGDQIVEGLADPRIRLIRQENGGVSAARNRGIAEAKAELVAFLDADDEWLPEKLQLQFDFLERYPDIKWTAGAFIQYRDDKPVAPESAFFSEWFEDEYVVKDALLPLSVGRCFWVVTTMIRKQVFKEVGCFDTALRVGEEINLWMRIAKKYPKILYIRKPVAKYNMYVPGSLTALDMQGFDTVAYSAPAHYAINAAKTADVSRAELFMGIARVHILRGLHFAVVTGNKKPGKILMTEFDGFPLGLKGLIMKAMIYMPYPLIYLAKAIKHLIIRSN